MPKLKKMAAWLGLWMDSLVPVISVLQEDDDELPLDEAATMVSSAAIEASWNGEGEWPKWRGLRRAPVVDATIEPAARKIKDRVRVRRVIPQSFEI